MEKNMEKNMEELLAVFASPPSSSPTATTGQTPAVQPGIQPQLLSSSTSALPASLDTSSTVVSPVRGGIHPVPNLNPSPALGFGVPTGGKTINPSAAQSVPVPQPLTHPAAVAPAVAVAVAAASQQKRGNMMPHYIGMASSTGPAVPPRAVPSAQLTVVPGNDLNPSPNRNTGIANTIVPGNQTIDASANLNELLSLLGGNANATSDRGALQSLSQTPPRQSLAPAQSAQASSRTADISAELEAVISSQNPATRPASTGSIGELRTVNVSSAAPGQSRRLTNQQPGTLPHVAAGPAGVTRPTGAQSTGDGSRNPTVTREQLVLGHFCRHAIKLLNKLFENQPNRAEKEVEFKEFIRVLWNNWVKGEIKKQVLLDRVSEFVRGSTPAAQEINVLNDFRTWYEQQVELHRAKAAGQTQASTQQRVNAVMAPSSQSAGVPEAMSTSAVPNRSDMGRPKSHQIPPPQVTTGVAMQSAPPAGGANSSVAGSRPTGLEHTQALPQVSNQAISKGVVAAPSSNNVKQEQNVTVKSSNLPSKPVLTGQTLPPQVGPRNPSAAQPHLPHKAKSGSIEQARPLSLPEPSRQLSAAQSASVPPVVSKQAGVVTAATSVHNSSHATIQKSKPVQGTTGLKRMAPNNNGPGALSAQANGVVPGTKKPRGNPKGPRKQALVPKAPINAKAEPTVQMKGQVPSTAQMEALIPIGRPLPAGPASISAPASIAAEQPKKTVRKVDDDLDIVGGIVDIEDEEDMLVAEGGVETKNVAPSDYDSSMLLNGDVLRTRLDAAGRRFGISGDVSRDAMEIISLAARERLIYILDELHEIASARTGADLDSWRVRQVGPNISERMQQQRDDEQRILDAQAAARREKAAKAAAKAAETIADAEKSAKEAAATAENKKKEEARREKEFVRERTQRSALADIMGKMVRKSGKPKSERNRSSNIPSANTSAVDGNKAGSVSGSSSVHVRSSTTEVIDLDGEVSVAGAGEIGVVSMDGVADASGNSERRAAEAKSASTRASGPRVSLEDCIFFMEREPRSRKSRLLHYLYSRGGLRSNDDFNRKLVKMVLEVQHD